MVFKIGEIQGVVVKPLAKFTDSRGWLSELFRHDELDGKYHPAMSYISVTNPGVPRGPHEHVDQADLFAFIGPSTFKVYLWDMRKNSPTFGNKSTHLAGEEHPASILVPAGVVHAYVNVGSVPGSVLNFPNRLFAGEGKKSPVDEIRHEHDPNSPYTLD
jgi:dTDP-4-dehydrorhamnose 3,5-epimerase